MRVWYGLGAASKYARRSLGCCHGFPPALELVFVLLDPLHLAGVLAQQRKWSGTCIKNVKLLLR